MALQTSPPELATLGIRNQWVRICAWLTAHSATAAFLFVGWTLLAAMPYVALLGYALRKLLRRHG